MYLPGQSTMEMSFESVQFDADLFAMANQQTFAADADYTTYRSEVCTVETGKTVTLDGTPISGSIRIGALKDGTGGELSVSDKVVTITDDNIAVGDEVEVSYEEAVTGANKIEVANNTSAVGELVAKWPVYATGDETTNVGGGVKGYVIMKIYKCRVTALPGLTDKLSSFMQ